MPYLIRPLKNGVYCFITSRRAARLQLVDPGGSGPFGLVIEPLVVDDEAVLLPGDVGNVLPLLIHFAINL